MLPRANDNGQHSTKAIPIAVGKPNSGFSLIEIMVTLAVAGVFVSVACPVFAPISTINAR